MTAIKSIRIAVLCYVHYKGWCEKLHRNNFIEREPWRGECPLTDRVMLDLYPPLVFRGSAEAFDEVKHRGMAPGTIFKEKATV